MAQKTHTMHGRDHMPGGADPLLPGFPTGDTVGDKILAALPAGFWKLNESSGSIAHDSSGNGQDLSTHTPELDPLWGAPAGPPGEQAANMNHGTAGFGGTSSRVSRTWAALTGDFTAGIWINLTEQNGTMVMGQGNPGRSPGAGWELRVTGPIESPFPNVPAAYMWGAPDWLWGLETLAPGSWAFLAIVYDSAATVFKFYVDGLLQDTSPPFTFTASATPLWVGHDGTLGSHPVDSAYFVGSYAFLVNRAMSGTELLAINDAPASGEGTVDDLVLGDTGDGGIGWVQPKVDVTVNGEPPPVAGTLPAPPADPTPPDTGPDLDDWIQDQPFLWDGGPFTVQPNTWTTIPFEQVVMVRFSNVDARGGTARVEIDPSDPSAAGWVDPAFPHAITIPHDMPFLPGNDFATMYQICLHIDAHVEPTTSYRQLRIFETTHQKTLMYSKGWLRLHATSGHGYIDVFRDTLSPDWTPPAPGKELFAEGDPGGFDLDGHPQIAFMPDVSDGFYNAGHWLPHETYGGISNTAMLKQGMRLVAQVWHDASHALEFTCGGTSPGYTPDAPYRPFFCVIQTCQRDWGPPWSDWPLWTL